MITDKIMTEGTNMKRTKTDRITILYKDRTMMERALIERTMIERTMIKRFMIERTITEGPIIERTTVEGPC
jgi:hypothetical protein